MTYAVALAILILSVGCSEANSPVSPTPFVPPPVSSTPPVTPAVFPPSDARFDLAFYRQFAHNALGGAPEPLRRKTAAQSIFIVTVDDAGTPIDPRTLDATAAALINVASLWTGQFGLAGLQMGLTEPPFRQDQIIVRWRSAPTAYCGAAAVTGTTITLAPKTAGCGCANLAINPAVAKHELGHILGFHHTDAQTDLMFRGSVTCDQQPSDRERYHAALAYQRPIGSAAP